MLSDGLKTCNAALHTVIAERFVAEDAKYLIGKIEAFEKNELRYWVRFGYKYLAPLKGMQIKDIVQRINDERYLKNKNYVVKIVTAVLDVTTKSNQRIAEEVLEGIDAFWNGETTLKCLEDISNQIYGIEYLANHVSKYDICNIYEAVHLVEIGEEKHWLPITPNDKYSFGIVYPWPGTDTAETELLARVTKAADNIGFDCVMLSDFGRVLDEEQLETDEIVDADKLDYVMTTHYESHKTVDSYYYHLLWNPPDIPLNTTYYEGKVLDNYIMNDDYLIYDFGGMSNHLRSMLIDKPRTLEGASTFVGSFPKSVVMEPNLDNPKLFYCGMNWEKALGNNNRHAGLFELLDKTGKVKFFGPDVVESWGGIRPWEGYDCYQYSIPFDGFSILKEINECGVCLAISSDAHRRAGAVTNRAYEACAAGAVIISDNNVFMEEYFGDSVLYVTYNKSNPKDTFEQIMEKYQWIVEHKEEALEMAKRSQQIFIEKFCMEKGILDVTKNHFSRFKTIEKDLFAKDNSKVVLVTKVLNTLKEKEIGEQLDAAVKNISRQYYPSIICGVICDEKIQREVEAYAKKCPINVVVVSDTLFDEKGVRCMTDGQAGRIVQEQIEHDYFMNIKENEIWFYDHVSTLVRTLEDDEAAVGAFSGLLSQDEKGIRRNYMFENMSYSRSYLQIHPQNLPMPGQFIFKKTAQDLIPEYMLGCLDGLEHVAYVAMAWIKNKLPITFSKRMSAAWEYGVKDSVGTVLDRDRQIRFIRGLVKFDLPSTGIGNGVVASNSGRSMREFMLTMPLTQSLSVRFWRKLACRFDNKKGLGKWIDKKYKSKLDKYNDLMDKLQEG